MPKNNDNNIAKAGLGIAALAAAAAGAVYFYGKGGDKHRKAIKGWMVKARGEVMDKMEGLKDISQAAYDKTVTDVLSRYEKLKKATPEELAALGTELKSHWIAISKQVNKTTKKPTADKAPARAKK